MKISGSPPTATPPQYLYPTFTTDSSAGHRSPRHQGVRPTNSTPAGMGYIVIPAPSQRQPASARARDRPDVASCSRLPAQPHRTPVVRRGTAETQTPRRASFPISHPHTIYAAPAPATKQRWSDPPPLDFSKSPYSCVPLPEIAPGPVTLNPILAYSDWRTLQKELNVAQRWLVDVRHCDHICAPATNPSLGSATILLPDGRGVTVHGSHDNHDVITVGDVLEALDTLLLGKPSRELSLSGSEESCACLSETTALHSLRSRYRRAGLISNDQGFDVWDLRIG
jgi:hypothetical protein